MGERPAFAELVYASAHRRRAAIELAAVARALRALACAGAVVHRGTSIAAHALVAAAHAHHLSATHVHRDPRATRGVRRAIRLATVDATRLAAAVTRRAVGRVGAGRTLARRGRAPGVLGLTLAVTRGTGLIRRASLASARARGIADAATVARRSRSGAVAGTRGTDLAGATGLAGAGATATGPLLLVVLHHRAVALAARAVAGRTVQRAKARTVSVAERMPVAEAVGGLAVVIPEAEAVAIRPRTRSVVGARRSIAVVAAWIVARAEPLGTVRRGRTGDIQRMPATAIDRATRLGIAGRGAGVEGEVADEEFTLGTPVVAVAGRQPCDRSSDEEVSRDQLLGHQLALRRDHADDERKGCMEIGAPTMIRVIGASALRHRCSREDRHRARSLERGAAAR
jgi:hypothetical protein